MSKEMKYVIIDECLPILFSIGQRHGDFGRMKPTSAGKCRIYYEEGKFTAECYGGSIDLNLNCHIKDKNRIEIMLNQY
jgi:hypothetical protein